MPGNYKMGENTPGSTVAKAKERMCSFDDKILHCFFYIALKSYVMSL